MSKSVPGSHNPENDAGRRTLKICGLAAVRARFQRDAASILRLYFDYPTGRKIGVICKALSAAKRIYRCVDPAELERIAGSVHHGGIVAVVPLPRPAHAAAADAVAWARRREPLLILDRVGNAHNLGAIARTAAFLGIPRIVVSGDPGAALPGDAAYRIAEGGLEKLEIRIADPLPEFLRAIAAAGYEVIGATGRSAGDVRPQALGERGIGVNGPLVAIVLGNEESGLAPEVAAACTRLAAIPGSGAVESLNVSAAAAILAWELLGRRRRRN